MSTHLLGNHSGYANSFHTFNPWSYQHVSDSEISATFADIVNKRWISMSPIDTLTHSDLVFIRRHESLSQTTRIPMQVLAEVSQSTNTTHPWSYTTDQDTLSNVLWSPDWDHMKTFGVTNSCLFAFQPSMWNHDSQLDSQLPLLPTRLHLHKFATIKL